MKSIVFNHVANQWVLYEKPKHILQAHHIGEVLSVLSQAESYSEQGYHSVGFCTYEASLSFDKAMQTHSPTKANLPLCYFAIYEDFTPYDLAGQYQRFSPDEKQKITWQPSITEEQYHHTIEKIKQHLVAGDCYQINYTYRLRGAFQGSTLSYFLNIIQHQETQLGCYIEHDDWAICSASPELFFQLDGNTIRTRPMKGTAARGHSIEEDQANQRWLAQSEKNKAENTMIVDMIRNDLNRIAEKGTVEVEALHTIEKYKTALQMTSSVKAQSSKPIIDIFKAMFPCASIIGAPRVKTMELIRDLEPDLRNIYTGSIGYMLPNRQAKFNVAIRTVYIDKLMEKAEFGLGGGIVWDSDSSQEYQESWTKAKLLFV